MKLRFLKGDWEFGKFKLQMKKDGCADVWEDVPTQEQEKPLKLWEKLSNATPLTPHPDVSKHQAMVSIDAVIELYEYWFSAKKPLGKFPEYLKEKML